MNTKDDDSIARLLEDSQQMLRRFSLLMDDEDHGRISVEVQKDTLAGMNDALEPIVDGIVEVFVEEDGSAATAEFRPPSGGNPVTLDQVEALLAERKVVHGILWEIIRRSLEACNLEFQLVTGAVIARATDPVAYVPAHLRLDPKWESHRPVSADDRADVDFKKASPFLTIAKGEVIALKVDEVFGAQGCDVLGREIPFPTEKTSTWSPGALVEETQTGFVAASDGRLMLTPPGFAVHPVLELKEGVDYRTGNIEFPGEVILHGRIAPGFSVSAGGGLSSTETLDAFLVKVGDELVSQGGIIGNGDGRVEASGPVKVKFLEHVYLLAKQQVTIEGGVLNSIVKTQGRLVLGEKGVLAGGQVHALDGADVYQIGTPTGPNTELFIGLDYVGMEKIMWIRDRSHEAHDQLHKVDQAIPYGGARTAELQAAAKKLRAEIADLTEAARTLLMSLKQNEAAEVIVRGSVYPGNTIEICHVRFMVTQKLSSVRFWLDKRQGRVGVSPLASESSKTTTPSGVAPKKR